MTGLCRAPRRQIWRLRCAPPMPLSDWLSAQVSRDRVRRPVGSGRPRQTDRGLSGVRVLVVQSVAALAIHTQAGDM